MTTNHEYLNSGRPQRIELFVPIVIMPTRGAVVCARPRRATFTNQEKTYISTLSIRVQSPSWFKHSCFGSRNLRWHHRAHQHDAACLSMSGGAGQPSGRCTAWALSTSPSPTPVALAAASLAADCRRCWPPLVPPAAPAAASDGRFHRAASGADAAGGGRCGQPLTPFPQAAVLTGVLTLLAADLTIA